MAAEDRTFVILSLQLPAVMCRSVSKLSCNYYQDEKVE